MSDGVERVDVLLVLPHGLDLFEDRAGGRDDVVGRRVVVAKSTRKTFGVVQELLHRQRHLLGSPLGKKDSTIVPISVSPSLASSIKFEASSRPSQSSSSPQEVRHSVTSSRAVIVSHSRHKDLSGLEAQLLR